MSASPLPRVSLDVPWDIGQNQHLGAATTLITACTDYLQALTGLCGTGVQLMRHFVTPSPIASVLPNREKETAQKMSDVWEEVNKVTQQAVWTVRNQTLQTLQNWLIKQKATGDRPTHPSKAFKSSDLSKLLSSCLLALMQLQYQFSLINCQSFAELVASQVDQGSVMSEGFADEKTVPTQCPSPAGLGCLMFQGALNSATNSSSSFEDIHDKDDSDDLSDDPTVATALLARRSSYGGSLHNTSPPPPNSVLGRRWSVPGGDAALDEDWTKEIQQRAGSKGSLYISGIGRAIRGTGNTRRKGSLISKEELEDVIDLLSCKQDARSDHNSSTPATSTQFLNLLLPLSCTATNLSPTNSHSHLPLQQEGSQRSGGCWGWTSPQMRSATEGGLLTVAASQSYINKDAKRNSGGWLPNTHSPPPTYLNTFEQQLNSLSQPRTSSPTSTSAATFTNSSLASNGVEPGDTEGAFSIGLNLTGCDLVASVQQRRPNNEKAPIPVVLTPPIEDKNSHNINLPLDDSCNGANVAWSSAKQSSNGQNMAAFLSYALEGPAGPTIWTPSPRDYAAPQGAYSFQLGP